ncbi:hypothetical protein ACFV3R_06665 [Streptomyces sp. NPDC059740]|uniref:hypothetical protein n=1 Tax=Streptomyces sp. NPDC059740 TaxID=3346926 RepID=UPI0036494183
MGIWPRDHYRGSTPISEDNARTVASQAQAKANDAQAAGNQVKADYMRQAVDRELDTLNDIRRLKAHGFKQPKH